MYRLRGSGTSTRVNPETMEEITFRTAITFEQGPDETGRLVRDIEVVESEGWENSEGKMIDEEAAEILLGPETAEEMRDEATDEAEGTADVPEAPVWADEV